MLCVPYYTSDPWELAHVCPVSEPWDSARCQHVLLSRQECGLGGGAPSHRSGPTTNCSCLDRALSLCHSRFPLCIIIHNSSTSIYYTFTNFSGGSDGKESACNSGDPRLIPGLGRSPGEENDNPLQYFLPGEFHGQRSLVSYSPWGPKIRPEPFHFSPTTF